MKCPVCELTDIADDTDFCPQCSWEFVRWLTDISQGEKDKYNKRLEIARQNWQNLQALKKQAEQQSESIASEKPEAPKQNESGPVTASEKDDTLYSEKREVPELKRDPFETVEEFRERIRSHAPVPAGTATLAKEKYNIETGKFPLEVLWDDRVKDVERIPPAESELHVIAERDLARAIYEVGPKCRLFIKLGIEGEKVVADTIELSAKKEILPVTVPEIKEGEWTDLVTGMEFIYVPGGTFMMGDIFGDGRDDEKPVHEVQLDGFCMGKYQVTQGQWKKVMGNNPSYFKKGDDYPVESVSWDDAQEFIKKLTGMNNGKYNFRLPAEAEWEYAARSGGKKERYAGGDDIDAVAWYGKNSGESTHPVGKKTPNGLGIYDMSGNVWEWCQDWSGSYPADSFTNPTGADTGSFRVLRGGSRSHDAWHCRTALRHWFVPDRRLTFNGFRLVLLPGQ